MVIINAQLYMYHPKSPDREFYVAGLGASIRVGGIPNLCILSKKGAENIPVEKEMPSIMIEIVTGEWNLQNIKVGAPFEIVMGSYVMGRGVIKDVLEIYVEKSNVEAGKHLLNFKEELKEIVDIASSLDNAIIEEGVVEMLDE